MGVVRHPLARIAPQQCMSVHYGEAVSTSSRPVLERGVQIRIPGESTYARVDFAQFTDDGCLIYAETPSGIRRFSLTLDELAGLEVLREDGAADPAVVVVGLWAEWMRAATVEAKATTLATTPLRPYVHQTNAVYGAMLPQPRLRFLLADEPGTGKTIMAGMYLREMQRLGFIRRALVVCPAHLVEKWQADFGRFFGGGLRRIKAETVREGALGIEHDLWVTSLDLASVNPMVQEAIRPDRAGWDAVVVDEAHRMTLSAQAYYRLGVLLSRAPRVLLMTATPHRGKEALFRGLMHLVDPDVYPSVDESDEPSRHLKPGQVHFLRRMKEDLVDYDGVTNLFKGRRARNIAVPLNATEAAFYNEALELVDRFFPAGSAALAKMVYGKRAASSLYALRETLKRRRDTMGSDSPIQAAMLADPESEDEASQDEAKVVVEQSLSAKEEKAALKQTIERLDVVLANSEASVSKWPRMENECLLPNGIRAGNALQAVIFTEFADTADWLVRRFRTAGYTAERYSGRDSDVDRERVRTRFANREYQVIVSTDAGNEGIDLQTAHVLVNWDIPWSLVRLEQRMGRIHRVGQTREVELFNLVATGTREGQVLEVLLSNFVIAADRLGGKLFDSLSLVAELVNLDFQQILARTYDSPERAAAALASAKAASAQRLEDAARRAAAEEDALRSAVDVTQAVAELQRETLERINPQIVEAFLTRVGAAGLFKVSAHAAGPGIYVLASGKRQLPRQLGSTSQVLVGTSAHALESARAAGAELSGAFALGPSQPGFNEVVAAAADQAGPALFQGGRLRDRTSITDYALFVYEAEVTEFGGERRTTWPFLVRADDTGARPLRWEILANLEAGDPQASKAHPARTSDADARASEVGRQERDRRATVLKAWMSTAAQELERLPSALTSDIEDPARRVEARKRVSGAVQARLADLERMAQVEVGEPRRLGWAYVKGAAPPPDPTQADSEEIAMRHVAELLRGAGWSVSDVHLEGRGYDLLARKGRDQRSVEVKGVWDSASARGVRMTGGELLIARQIAGNYWLYVVDHCSEGSGRLFGAYQNPADRFEELMKDLTVVAVPGSALSSARGEVSPT